MITITITITITIIIIIIILIIRVIVIILISNSNSTEWSTIQGVIARVISKSGERDYSLNCTPLGQTTN